MFAGKPGHFGFNPRPSFLAGETPRWLSAATHAKRFNPRPSFLAGETAGTAGVDQVAIVSIHARHFWRAKPRQANCRPPPRAFQSTPVISGGRNHACAASNARTSRFNPRPSFLAGETAVSARAKAESWVSIHARHFWRAKPERWPADRLQARFQSTPVISVGRNLTKTAEGMGILMFQSTPVISGGRNVAIREYMRRAADSIHARHFWRAKPDGALGSTQ